jgi:hypothetical protein
MGNRQTTQSRAPATVVPAAVGSLQRKLTIGPSNDDLEQEADRVADQALASAPANSIAENSPPRLQRLSGHGSRREYAAPASVNRVLGDAGQPLERRLQLDMGQRLGHDFSRVRVHSGTAAERSTRELDAHAYTAGHHVVFGAGRYAPDTSAGRTLLAHELVHVVQQGANANVALQRKGGTARGFFANIGRAFASIFGDEPEFAEKTLLDYLKVLDNANDIEDDYDSDDKARLVVQRWMSGASKFNLSAKQMVLLIREMVTGYVGGDDQDRILDLLTHAQNGDLREIFAPAQINPRRLEDDFGGRQKKRLLAFYEGRFQGGKAALYKGSVDPISGPDAGAPLFAWNWPLFLSKMENSAYRSGELAAELSRLSDSDRDRALKDISGQRILLKRAGTDLRDKIAAESDAGKKASLTSALADINRRQQRVDTVMQTAFKDIVETEAPATLLAKTHLPNAVEKAEIKTALKPDVRSVGGVPLPFQRHILGEAKTYDEKIRILMPTMIQGYWDDMVKGKEAAQHSDPTKVHKLDEFDSIANAAKDATDKVFGAYYSAAAHPPFRSDRPMPVGRGQLHDLFADTEADLAAMGTVAKRKMAKALVFYFFQSDEEHIGALNRHHNASPKFSDTGAPLNPEATLLDSIATAWVATAAHVKKLNEIDRNWDASANPVTHEVNIQIFKKATVPEDRRFLWDMYQTLIHEYLHTLADPAYSTFADSFGGNSLENNTLIEGVDSLLDEVVWQDAKGHVSEPAVRAKVEGVAYSAMPFDAALVPPIYNRRYPSYTQAVKLAHVVGIRNIYAAYFLGKVDLIKP